LLGAHIRVPDHVVYRTFVRETVVLNLATGRYHGINPTGGRILDLLADDATLGSAAQVLAEEYQRPLVDVERDVCTFCEELRERGLIEVSLNGSR
jgi:Coenzyme PQQ synthesis protein D (PqqD)